MKMTETHLWNADQTALELAKMKEQSVSTATVYKLAKLGWLKDYGTVSPKSRTSKHAYYFDPDDVRAFAPGWDGRPPKLKKPTPESAQEPPPVPEPEPEQARLLVTDKELFDKLKEMATRAELQAVETRLNAKLADLATQLTTLTAAVEAARRRTPVTQPGSVQQFPKAGGE
jgi:hypothetical protein